MEEQRIVNPRVKVFDVSNPYLEDIINKFLDSNVVLMEIHNFGERIIMFYYSIEQAEGIQERVLSVVKSPDLLKN